MAARGCRRYTHPCPGAGNARLGRLPTGDQAPHPIGFRRTGPQPDRQRLANDDYLSRQSVWQLTCRSPAGKASACAGPSYNVLVSGPRRSPTKPSRSCRDTLRTPRADHGKPRGATGQNEHRPLAPARSQRRPVVLSDGRSETMERAGTLPAGERGNCANRRRRPSTGRKLGVADEETSVNCTENATLYVPAGLPVRGRTQYLACHLSAAPISVIAAQVQLLGLFGE